MKSPAITALAIAAALVVAPQVFAQDTFTVDITRNDGSGPVSPGDTIPYQITGLLTDNDNMGLAFFAFDLEVNQLAGDPFEFDLPSLVLQGPGADVGNFVQPLGYSVDFAGTPSGNDLIQAGGGQNTINNDPAAPPMEPFPSGDVELNVAHDPGAVLLDASFEGFGLMVPANTPDGTYELRLKPGSLFANVITAVDGEDYTVESVQTLIGEPLVFSVVSDALPPFLVHTEDMPDEGPVSTPCTGYIDSRIELNTPGGGAGTPGVTEVQIVFNEEVRGIGGGALSQADFAISDTAGTPPAIMGFAANVDGTTGRHVVTLTLDGPISLQEWTTIEANVEDMAGNPIDDQGNLGPGALEADRIDIGFLPMDIDQSGTVQVIDVLRLRQVLFGTCTQCPDCDEIEFYADLDRSGAIQALDFLRGRQWFLGTPPATMAWEGATIGVQP